MKRVVVLVVLSWAVWIAYNTISDRLWDRSHADVINEADVFDRTDASVPSKEVVIDLVDTASRSQIDSLENLTGEHFFEADDESFAAHRLMVCRPNGSVQGLISQLKKSDLVEVVEPNYVYSIPDASNDETYFTAAHGVSSEDPLFVYQWHMRQIHAPEAWAVTQGEGVVVAVIDTGVSHSGKIVEDLAQAKFVHPYNFITNKPDGNDDHGHGTHVAGTIAQVTKNGVGCVGVAPKAIIMPLKVLSRHGSGTVADIAAAVMFAADNGAKVINMSLGGGGRSEVFEKAVNYAHSKGVIVICAAGNSGREGVSYPAAYKNAVAVSAVDYSGNLAFYSSWGSEVAIAGPGGDSRSDKNGDGKPDGVMQNVIDVRNPDNLSLYGIFQGTSMATPHVAGVAALVASRGVLDPDKILQVLRSTAEPKGDAKKFGAGIVNALAAVKAAK